MDRFRALPWPPLPPDAQQQERPSLSFGYSSPPPDPSTIYPFHNSDYHQYPHPWPLIAHRPSSFRAPNHYLMRRPLLLYTVKNKHMPLIYPSNTIHCENSQNQDLFSYEPSFDHYLYVRPTITDDLNWRASSKQQQEQRNWAEITSDVLVMIFQIVGTISVVKSCGSVCRSWRQVTKDEPELWRRMDITNNDFDTFRVLTNAARLAIDRSRGKLEEFWIEDFNDDSLLQYLCDRTSVLKSLRLKYCDKISSGLNSRATEILGKELPNLKRFKQNGIWLDFTLPRSKCFKMFYNEQAFGIARTMHELRYLQLDGNNRLTNVDLKAILELCPHLETLDICSCHHVIVDSDMRARCSGIRILRLPDDPFKDDEPQGDIRSIMDFSSSHIIMNSGFDDPSNF